MSDVSTVQKLPVIGTIKEGIGIGAKNIGPILVNVILYVLTCWIPYLNVGTTIGLYIGIVAKASKGQPISMTEIFNPDYRKYMGEYFLTAGLVGVGVCIGMAFLIIPGCVISLAWSQAILLAIDKGKNPSEAISLSNKCTYGNKWRMFGINLLACLAFSIVIGIFSAIPSIGWLFCFIVGLFYLFVILGIQASVYKQLTANV
jgi:uncharacterized membrane protein